MVGFIPELVTRVSVEIESKDVDNAINMVKSNEILSQLGYLEELEDIKSKLESYREPVAEAIAKRLSSNQETIISTKHYITGMMANSVDIMSDGPDYLVGNTAMSIDGFPYPLAIEKGTKAHWIAPITFKALHWTDGSGEYWSKGHMVSGITADPFVEPSINTTMSDIDDIVKDIIDL